jgi:hypothetical protein
LFHPGPAAEGLPANLALDIDFATMAILGSRLDRDPAAVPLDELDPRATVSTFSSRHL